MKKAEMAKGGGEGEGGGRGRKRGGGGGVYFFFNDTATTEIYTLSPTRRSSDLSEVFR